nr:hypothetical protein [Tanacetum cinerariifolium]
MSLELHTDEEVDEQELEAHYSYMAKIQEVHIAESGTDSKPLEQNEQNDVESDDERVAFANFIANLKLEVDENKMIQKQLKKANTTLAQELKECKAILVETKKQLNNEILHEKDSKSALSVISVQFDMFIHSNMLNPFDPYSSSASYDQEVRQNFRDYTQMEAQTFKETIIQSMKSIELCIVKRESHEQELQNGLNE